MKKQFEKITKHYALTNSYYKNRRPTWPDTMAEILDYRERYGELPFRYEGDNWLYDAMCERQKRRGVYISQYLTPDRTARQMAALAARYFESDDRIVDACCGTGQLTRGLLAEGFSAATIVAFDADCEMADLYRRLYPDIRSFRAQFHELHSHCPDIVANPPFETSECVEFLQWLAGVQLSGDHAVLLLPLGFIDKQRPKTVQEIMRNFRVHHREPMQESFARTNMRAEIVVFERQ